jgi:hypothetical protein
MIDQICPQKAICFETCLDTLERSIEMSFVRPTPEEAAASLGFDMGRTYAIRAIPPQGKTQEALERQMAQAEQIVGLPHLRGLFRRRWLRGYHYWHVSQLARECVERTYPDMSIVQRRVQQQGDDEHDPWTCEFLRMDSLSGEPLSCIVIARWLKEADGSLVNWWIVTPEKSPADQQASSMEDTTQEAT